MRAGGSQHPPGPAVASSQVAALAAGPLGTEQESLGDSKVPGMGAVEPSEHSWRRARGQGPTGAAGDKGLGAPVGSQGTGDRATGQ